MSTVSAVPDCFEKVKAFAKTMGRKINDSDLRDMAVTLAEKRAELLSNDEFQKAAAELYVDRLTREANARRAARTINLQKAQMAKAVVFQDVANMSTIEKINGWILGNSRKIGNAMNLSVPDMAKGMTTSWLRDVRSVLATDLKVAESGLLGKEVTQDMAAIERGATQSESGNSQAFRIAKAYNSVLAQAFETKQAFDPFLGKITDYFHRATHDRAKISAVERADWVQAAMRAYGEKSFPELTGEKKIEAFANIYDQIKKGTYESMLDIDADPSDLMRKMAHSRTLIPNDWQSFYEYNQQFGRDNVHTSVLRSLESAANDVAMIQKFGSAPKETFNAVMSHAIEKGTPEEIDALKANRQTIENNFRAVTERSPAPATNGKARFLRGFMGVTQLAKNSAAFLRSWDDLSNMASRLSDDTGGGFLSGFTEGAASYVSHFFKSQEERMTAAEDMYLFSKSALHNLYQEFGHAAPAAEGFAGKFEAGLSTALELQSHVSLMQRHISAMDAAMATVLSRRLGRLSESAFEELPKEVVGGLSRYGIGKSQWELMRLGTETWADTHSDAAMGRMDRMLNVDSMKAIPDEALANYVKENGAWKGEGEPPKSVLIRARTELEAAVGGMINQHAEAASSTAGLSERAWMYGNADMNTWKGLSLRMLWQFKSAIVKNYDTVMRSYYSNPMKPQGDFSKIAKHVILSSGLWAAGETAKTIFEGKTPEDPMQPTFIAKAVLNSGAGGIIGDTVLSELARSEKGKDIAFGVLKGLAGPGITTSADVLGIMGQLGYSMKDPHVKFPGNDIGRVITQNIPYQNLFWTKAAFNYYIANGIREWMAPGYLGNVVRRTNQTPGMLGDRQQYFIFNPTE